MTDHSMIFQPAMSAALWDGNDDFLRKVYAARGGKTIMPTLRTAYTEMMKAEAPKVWE